MTKNLIIGFASNYEWKDLQYWVNSIRKTNFSGDIVIVSDNINKKTIEALTANKVELAIFGHKNENGDYESPQSIAPHVNRFFYLWHTLNNTKNNYRFVITTDTRDVVFQSNPSDWLENNLVMHSLVASSEGLKYKDEPWGNKNILESFGPFYHNILKDELIYNVGVIAGDFEYVKGLLSLIFQLSINRPIPIVDQAVYNFILHTEPFKNDTNFTSNINNWAIQLGTALQAVQAGSGDLGQSFISSEEGRKSYLDAYQDHPVIIENGIVKGLDNTPYVIVHQYDRVPELASEVRKLYGDNDATESRTIFYHPV